MAGCLHVSTEIAVLDTVQFVPIFAGVFSTVNRKSTEPKHTIQYSVVWGKIKKNTERKPVDGSLLIRYWGFDTTIALEVISGV